MKKKKHINQLISIKFTDRKSDFNGFVMDYNDDWTLMKYNPVDYVMDGYVLLKHKNIEGLRHSSEEKFREKVIKLKGLVPTEKEMIPINDLETILKFLTKKFGVFQFYTKSEKACYVGRLISIDSKQLVIDFLDPKGKWTGEMEFRPDDIRVIEFDTDYINSLKLLAAQRKRK
jgi:hypothetical protein